MLSLLSLKLWKCCYPGKYPCKRRALLFIVRPDVQHSFDPHYKRCIRHQIASHYKLFSFFCFKLNRSLWKKTTKIHIILFIHIIFAIIYIKNISLKYSKTIIFISVFNCVVKLRFIMKLCNVFPSQSLILPARDATCSDDY